MVVTCFDWAFLHIVTDFWEIKASRHLSFQCGIWWSKAKALSHCPVENGWGNTGVSGASKRRKDVKRWLGWLMLIDVDWF